MRFTAAYYLLLLYCSVIVRCALPVACDTMSHVFNEEEHLATVHAVYGNNHVEKEIASQEKGVNKNQPGARYEDQVQEHEFTESFCLGLFIHNKHQSYTSFLSLKIPVVFIPQPIQPPRVS